MLRPWSASYTTKKKKKKDDCKIMIITVLKNYICVHMKNILFMVNFIFIHDNFYI